METKKVIVKPKYVGKTPRTGEVYKNFLIKLPKNFEGSFWLIYDCSRDKIKTINVLHDLSKNKLISSKIVESKHKSLLSYKIIKITSRFTVSGGKLDRKEKEVFDELKKIGYYVVSRNHLSTWEVFDFYVGNFPAPTKKDIKIKKEHQTFALGYEAILRMNRQGVLKTAKMLGVKFPKYFGCMPSIKVPLRKVRTYALKNHLARKLNLI